MIKELKGYPVNCNETRRKTEWKELKTKYSEEFQIQRLQILPQK